MCIEDVYFNAPLDMLHYCDAYNAWETIIIYYPAKSFQGTVNIIVLPGKASERILLELN